MNEHLRMITRGRRIRYLVHEDLGTRVQTGCYRIVKRVFETFLFAYDAVQKVCAIYMRGLQTTHTQISANGQPKKMINSATKKTTYQLFIEIDLYHRLYRISNMYQTQRTEVRERRWSSPRVQQVCTWSSDLSLCNPNQFCFME